MNANAADIALPRNASASRSSFDQASRAFISTSNIEFGVMFERISTGC